MYNCSTRPSLTVWDHGPENPGPDLDLGEDLLTKTLFSLQGGLLRKLQQLRCQWEGYTHKPRSHGCLAFISYVQPGKTQVMLLGSQNFPVAYISITGFYCVLSEHLSVL